MSRQPLVRVLSWKRNCNGVKLGVCGVHRGKEENENVNRPTRIQMLVRLLGTSFMLMAIGSTAFAQFPSPLDPPVDVPEPTGLLLIGSGLLGIWALRRIQH